MIIRKCKMSRVAGRPRSRTDAQVFAATLRVLGRLGPQRMTLADVGAEAGLAPSTLVERYGSKRALLLASVRASVVEVGPAFGADMPALDALVEGLVALSRPLHTRRALANHLALLAHDVSDPDFRRVARQHAAARLARLRALLFEAQAAGEVLASTDPETLAGVVDRAYNGALITWAVAGTGPLETRLREAIAAVLDPWRATLDRHG
jgi:AcrR family transcriptional regulator